MLLDGDEEVLGKWPLVIDPLSVTPEAGAASHFGDFAGVVFVRAFGPDGLALFEPDAQARGGDLDELAGF